MKKRFLSLTVGFLAVFPVFSQTAQEDIAANPRLSASNHVAYQNSITPESYRLSPAPAGYEPFYISHYGRHGSRWLSGYRSYHEPVKILEIAERNHRLTARGEQLLSDLRQVMKASTKRLGELSDYGAEQHRGIAERMYSNFPTVFLGDASVDARSTIIIRCILSMINETSAFKSLNPSLNVVTDASMHDMYYTGWGHGEDTLANRVRNSMKKAFKPYHVKIDASRFVSQLIGDKKFVADSIESEKLMEDVFTIAGSLQNHHRFDEMNMFPLFTQEELYQLWRNQNIYWYTHWANSPANGNRVPFQERELLRNMLSSADSALMHGSRGASLRFGHETCLLPLACLMELDSVNYSTADLEHLHEHWQNYRIFPMGCNIQMIFYKKMGSTGNDDILVKVLFNEHEAKLPFTTDHAPYYRWDTIKGYYFKKIETAIDWGE